jgi:hypothetical protein
LLIGTQGWAERRIRQTLDPRSHPTRLRVGQDLPLLIRQKGEFFTFT